MAIAFKGEDMRCEPVQEETVVRDYHGAASKVLNRVFQSAQGLYIKVVGRLIQ